MAQATGDQHPLLERVKFLAIVGTNLEEFFMIRVAALLRKARAGGEDAGADGMTTSLLLTLIRQEAGRMLDRQAACWNHTLKPLLDAKGVHVLDPAEWSPTIVEWLEAHFKGEILPALDAARVRPGASVSARLEPQPEPRRGRQTRRQDAVRARQDARRAATFPCAAGGALAEAGRAFVYLEDVIRANVQLLFPDTQVKGAHLFRVVRDADIVIQEDEADDLLESVDQGLKQRRHGALAMLQVEQSMPRRVLDILMENFEIEPENVYRTSDRLGFGDWMELASTGAARAEVSAARVGVDLAGRRAGGRSSRISATATGSSIIRSSPSTRSRRSSAPR